MKPEDETFIAIFSETDNELYPVVFSGEADALDAGMEQVIESGVQKYAGPDTVVPGTRDQVLPTGGKRVSGDITVTKIPYSEVSNTSGGTTVIIGG